MSLSDSKRLRIGLPRRRAELVGFFQELFGTFDRLHLVLVVEHDRVGALTGQLENFAQKCDGRVVDLGVGVARVVGHIDAARNRQLDSQRFDFLLDWYGRIAAPLADRARRGHGLILLGLDLLPHQRQDLMRLRRRLVLERLPLGELVLELDLGLGCL